MTPVEWKVLEAGSQEEVTLLLNSYATINRSGGPDDEFQSRPDVGWQIFSITPLAVGGGIRYSVVLAREIHSKEE